MSRREEIRHLRQSALEGVGAAQYDLACAYADGNGVPKNPRTAFRWFLKAAEVGEPESMTAVGFCYLNGEGIDPDEDAAVAWLRKAKAAGSSDADRYLTGCRIYGQGMEQDLEGGLAEAEQLFEATQDQEYAYLLACAYADLKHDEERARHWHERAATLGHDESMVWMGYYCRFGVGLPRNLKKAFEWYERAAEAGNDAGMENLAVCYQHGEGVAQDLEAAYQCRVQAADLGHLPSRRWLGKHLIHGVGVDADPARGLSMLEELAGDDPGARMMLGEIYYYGEGTAVDMERARQWFQKAADANLPEAYTFLGTMAWYGEAPPRTRPRRKNCTAWRRNMVNHRRSTILPICSMNGASSRGPIGVSSKRPRRATGLRLACSLSAAWRAMMPTRKRRSPTWNPPSPKKIRMRCTCARSGCATASADLATSKAPWNSSTWPRFKAATPASNAAYCAARFAG